MRVIARFAFLLAPAAWACSCGAGTQAPACEVFGQSKTVFLGTVLSHNDDGSGKFTQQTSYLVRVDEAFTGLAPEEKEVFIDPGSFTSCYTHFDVGVQYLFFVGAPPSFLATTIMKGSGGAPKPAMAAWAGKSNLKTYVSAGCHPTRAAARAGEDIAWIRSRLREATPARVFGYAAQNHQSGWYRLFQPSADISLPGAEIILSGGLGVRTVVSGPDGRYAFEDVAAGRYFLTGALAPWKSPRTEQITVSPGGCVRRDLNFLSEGILSGTVLDAEGKPLARVRVEAVLVGPDGSLRRDEVSWAESDGDGRFQLKNLPAGEFVAGTNIAQPATAELPYPPTFVSEGKRFVFEPHQRQEGTILRLPKPLSLRKVRVVVRTADGKPVVRGARAFADQDGKRAAFEQAKADGIVELTLIQGVAYELRADRFDLGGARAEWRDSLPVRLPAGNEPATIEIRLKP